MQKNPSFPTTTHSVHVLSVSQTKASLNRGALSSEGGRVMGVCVGGGGEEGGNGGQHVGICLVVLGKKKVCTKCN